MIILMNQDKISCHFPHLLNVALDGIDRKDELIVHGPDPIRISRLITLITALQKG